MSGKLSIVMPVFNEAEGIAEFLNEIRENFKTVKPTLVIVDDCSTDETWSILSKMKKQSNDLILIHNQINLGHGQSTMRALQNGLLENVEFVMSIDGDGQFLGDEMYNFYKAFCAANSCYGEGVRVFRQDPWFRKIISFVTRLLVFTKSRRRTIDANTPARIYKAETLGNLVKKIESTSLVPNLRMSIEVRKTGIDIFTYKLTNIPRRAQSSQGTSWGTRKTIFPNKRLVDFCKKAIKEFI